VIATETSSEGGVRKRIKDAGVQLGRQLKDWRAGAGTRGVVALSITRLVNPGDKFLRYSQEDEAVRFLRDSLEDLQRLFQGTVDGLPKKVIGVFWHIITPAVDRTENMFVVAQETLLQGINWTSPQDDAPVRQLFEQLKKSLGWS
jgi:hypothetical protein